MALDEEFVERVLSGVEQIPAGQVATYGDLAARSGGGPRQVGTVLARYGAAVPWWRIVRFDGRPATGHEEEALRHLQEDGAPVTGGRVDLDRARWSGGVTGEPRDTRRANSGPGSAVAGYVQG